MRAPVWEDTRAPLIASVLFPSVCSCSSSLSAAPSFRPLLPPRLARPQRLTHALPEWVYQVDVVGMTVVVGLAGRLFHIYDVRQMQRGGRGAGAAAQFMMHALGCMSDGKGAWGWLCVCARGVDACVCAQVEGRPRLCAEFETSSAPQSHWSVHAQLKTYIKPAHIPKVFGHAPPCFYLLW